MKNKFSTLSRIQTETKRTQFVSIFDAARRIPVKIDAKYFSVDRNFFRKFVVKNSTFEQTAGRWNFEGDRVKRSPSVRRWIEIEEIFSFRSNQTFQLDFSAKIRIVFQNNFVYVLNSKRAEFRDDRRTFVD